MPTFEKAPDEVADLINTVMAKHHPALTEVSCNVSAWFAHAETDDNGLPKGPALRWAGYQAAAVIMVNPLKRRVQGLGDAEMTIDGDRWENWSEEQQLALIDHELTHLQVMKSKDGLVKADDIGRPRLKVRLHDWQIGGFAEVVERHGEDSFDFSTVQAMVNGYGQLLFPWAPDRDAAPAQRQTPEPGAEREFSKEVLEAARDLCPGGKGSRLSSVTISTNIPGCKPVTLTKSTRKKIGRMLEEKKRGQKAKASKASGTQKKNVTTADGRKITPREMVREIGDKFMHA